MAQRLSRRKMAEFAAEQLLAGKSSKDALKEIAAYLIETNRTGEAELVVRDIEDALAREGVMVADVTSARPLSKAAKADVTKMIGAKQLHLRETIDETVLGGVRINLPGKRYDGTIRHRLAALKAKQL